MTDSVREKLMTDLHIIVQLKISHEAQLNFLSFHLPPKGIPPPGKFPPAPCWNCLIMFCSPPMPPICWRTRGSIILATCWFSLAIWAGLTFLLISPPVYVCGGEGGGGVLRERGEYESIHVHVHMHCTCTWGTWIASFIFNLQQENFHVDQVFIKPPQTNHMNSFP